MLNKEHHSLLTCRTWTKYLHKHTGMQQKRTVTESPFVDLLGRVSSGTLPVCSALPRSDPGAGAAPDGSCAHTGSSDVCSSLWKDSSTDNMLICTHLWVSHVSNHTFCVIYLANLDINTILNYLFLSCDKQDGRHSQHQSNVLFSLGSRHSCFQYTRTSIWCNPSYISPMPADNIV